MPLAFSNRLPRHAFSIRDAARAGDIWRCFQEAAVEGSTRCGWPPSRYREVGSAFVVREMTVVHHAEPSYGQPLDVKTWVANFRRGILTTREIRLYSEGQPVAAASQEWVHVTDGLKPVRASAECQDAFQPEDVEPKHELPQWESLPIRELEDFEFKLWHTWMDPLGHANHPMYLDWCDEALSQQMAVLGLDPVQLCPVAERVSWKLGVEAPDLVRIKSKLVGRTSACDAVFEHAIENSEGRLCASATTVRRLVDGTGQALIDMLMR